MKKMNNKGFSLVELIVVVLIMAIIAVALAPQVMKWVEKSRLSADRDTYENLISNVQVALVDKKLPKQLTASVTFTINTEHTEATIEAGTGDTYNLINALNNVNASWQTPKAKRNGASYKFTVSEDKQITRSTTEGEDPAQISDDDLDAGD